MYRILAFQHTINEPLGYLEQLLKERGIPYEYNRLWETNEIPRNNDATHLIFLGGPMSVNDEDVFPYLAQEKELIRKSLKRNLPILGLCLGAQLIASALGAQVYRFVNETGWYITTKTSASESTFVSFPEQFHVFEFHSETFGIPCGGRLLSTGDQVVHQAFRYKSAIALQFHLEMTAPLIADWCQDLRKAKKERIMRDTERHLAGSNQLCRQFFWQFIGLKIEELSDKKKMDLLPVS
jgi:GMP synthase (glutamine-hydrolysing)